MLSINGKKFMTLPEAVQWLLDNNALPFQSTANYVADTVIAKTTIVNPSPAEIRVGSLVLFADSKVGTVSGVTDVGFMVGQEYTDIADSLINITSIALDVSDHVIFTLSDGRTIDAGQIKAISNFSINASQHLIANYNDGTSQDLGAIFSGDVAIFEHITDSYGNKRFVEGDIDLADSAPAGISKTYGKWSLSGSHLMIVLVLSLTNGAVLTNGDIIANLTVPSWIHDKIFPLWASNVINRRQESSYADDWSTQSITTYMAKRSSNRLQIVNAATVTLTADRNVRVQYDLLIDN